MPDEGLHEIQLNGKQLVFLFMTATVVAVVIFLCGVMVGRGVPAQRATVLAAEGADPTIPEDAHSDAAADAAATPAGGPSESASPSSRLGLTYPNRLEEPDPVAEEVPAGVPDREPFATPAVAKAPPPPAAAAARPPSSKPAAAAATVAAKAPAPEEVPPGAGFVVQVAAVRQRTEADAIRGRLAKKGYPAFVTTASTSGATTTYRVRVGKYPSRGEADTVAAKLEREEQFKPWVTR